MRSRPTRTRVSTKPYRVYEDRKTLARRMAYMGNWYFCHHIRRHYIDPKTGRIIPVRTTVGRVRARQGYKMATHTQIHEFYWNNVTYAEPYTIE